MCAGPLTLQAMSAELMAAHPPMNARNACHRDRLFLGCPEGEWDYWDQRF